MSSIRTFLVKIAARCNINCTYCYEYNLEDTTWRQKPALMSLAVLEAATERIAEHVKKHELKNVSVIFHGGEPLLVQKDFLRRAVTHISKALEDLASVSFGMQSNGILLSREWLDVLSELNVRVGISCDGPRAVNDRYRLDRHGKSTYDGVVRTLDLISLEDNRRIWGGVLTVIDLATDPIEILEFFLRWNPPSIDFLFPLKNHQTPPAGLKKHQPGFGYGWWLASIFDYWWDNDLSAVHIRTFEDIINLLLGGQCSVESFGLAPVQLLVIQTDGAYEGVDSLKSSYDGAVVTGKSVFSHPVDEVTDSACVAPRLDRESCLAEECRMCRYKKVCGGGYYPHRWHPKRGFRTPSVYCHDLMFLIDHVEKALRATGDEELVKRLDATVTVS